MVNNIDQSSECEKLLRLLKMFIKAVRISLKVGLFLLTKSRLNMKKSTFRLVAAQVLKFVFVNLLAQITRTNISRCKDQNQLSNSANDRIT